jgi:hypothetical protein
MSDGTLRDPRETKLPKWAQDKLNILRMRLSESNHRIQELSPETSTVFMDPYADIPVGLGTDPKIEFTFPDATIAGARRTRRYIQIGRIRERNALSQFDDRLLLHASDALLIIPRSTNTVEVADRRAP